MNKEVENISNKIQNTEHIDIDDSKYPEMHNEDTSQEDVESVESSSDSKSIIEEASTMSESEEVNQEIEETSFSTDIEEASTSSEVSDREYFGDNDVFIESSEDKEAVWEDTESEEEKIRDMNKMDVEWTSTKKFRRREAVDSCRLRIICKPGLFKSNYRIKIIKYNGEYISLVDTMNIIYILKDMKLYKTIKIQNYSISDAEWYNDKLYVSSEKSSKIQEIYTNGSNEEVRMINKPLTRNIRRLKCVTGYLYVVGDTFVVLDEFLNVIEEVYENIKDFDVYKGDIFCLNNKGDILQYNKKLQLKNKIIYDDCFSFNKIQGLTNYLVVYTSTGLVFINDKFEYVKETKEIKDSIVGCIEYDEYILYFTDKKNGLKVLDRDLSYINRKISLPVLDKIIQNGKYALGVHFREVHLIDIDKYTVKDE